MPYWTLNELADYLHKHEYRAYGEDSIATIAGMECYVYANSTGKLFSFPIKQNVGWIYHVMITVNSQLEVQ